MRIFMSAVIAIGVLYIVDQRYAGGRYTNAFHRVADTVVASFENH